MDSGRGSQVVLGESRERGAGGMGQAEGVMGKMVVLETYLLRRWLKPQGLGATEAIRAKILSVV